MVPFYHDDDEFLDALMMLGIILAISVILGFL